MKRNHIHLAQGVPSDGVISGEQEMLHVRKPIYSHCHAGMRNSAQVLIYINLERALAGGLKFYLSDNGVILSEGNETGVIPPIYFEKVTDKQGRLVEGWVPPSA